MFKVNYPIPRNPDTPYLYLFSGVGLLFFGFVAYTLFIELAASRLQILWSGDRVEAVGTISTEGSADYRYEVLTMTTSEGKSFREMADVVPRCGSKCEIAISSTGLAVATHINFLLNDIKLACVMLAVVFFCLAVMINAPTLKVNNKYTLKGFIRARKLLYMGVTALAIFFGSWPLQFLCAMFSGFNL